MKESARGVQKECARGHVVGSSNGTQLVGGEMLLDTFREIQLHLLLGGLTLLPLSIVEALLFPLIAIIIPQHYYYHSVLFLSGRGGTLVHVPTTSITILGAYNE